jgi:hypothetical protein
MVAKRKFPAPTSNEIPVIYSVTSQEAGTALVLEAIPLGVKQMGCEADYSSPSSAHIKNAYSFGLQSTSSWHGASLSTGTTLSLPRNATCATHHILLDLLSSTLLVSGKTHSP